MSVVDGGSASNLVQRVQDILLRPKPTWDKIDTEQATVGGLFTGYAMILAALPPIAGVIGSLVLAPMFGSLGAASLPFVIVLAIVQYGLGLLGIYIFAMVVDMLATSFDGTRNQIQAFKAVIYGATASWVGGALSFVPVLGWLIALAGGIYSLYLLYLGLPKLMKVPQEKAIGFVVVAVIVAVVIQVVVGMIATSVVMMAGFSAVASSAAVSAAAFQ